MKTTNLTYVGKVLKDGHLSLDEKLKQLLLLKEGDDLEITLKKLDDESDIVSDAKLSEQAKQYVDYLVGSGVTGKVLKKVIEEIKALDDKYQTMPRSEIIKEAYAIADRRARGWRQNIT